MKYASTIDTLAKRSGFGAAMFYDTTFRKWKQHQPALGWGNINNELYIQALTIGMQSSAPTGGPPSPFPPSATQDRPRCWEFMRYGSCSKNNCRFAHNCAICNSSHHVQNCTFGQKGGAAGRGRRPRHVPRPDLVSQTIAHFQLQYASMRLCHTCQVITAQSLGC